MKGLLIAGLAVFAQMHLFAQNYVRELERECAKGALVVLPDSSRTRIKAAFENRIAEIRATPNMSVPDGVERRYLSESGSDAADGKTPATAWRTTARLGKETLAPGSFVLFERGGVYRGGFCASKGVTYTAYGKGAKPRIYSSPENGADPAKWERTDATNVWRYKIGANDVGNLFAMATDAASGMAADVRTIEIADGENWWGAANFFGTNMPFTAKTDLKIDLRRRNYSNQCASLLMSDKGRVVWSDAQSEIVFANGRITVDADSPVLVETAAEPTLRGAYRHAMRKWFPPGGKSPDARFFTAPQLNTWIELTYHQNQKDILAYAKSMIAHGVQPGVLMIDDTWQAGYGDWRFEPSRFPDPKAMMDELHAMGYKVMLWMCPYVGMDIPAFRRIAWGRNPDDVRGYPAKGGFLTDVSEVVPGEGEYGFTEKPKACGWWNGYSAFLDFSHPNANAWFTETLDGLVKDFGVDGFKFDGADLGAYNLSDRRAHDPKATSGSLNNGYCEYALKYPFCEIRNTWQMQQIPVVVRLHDKMHEWSALNRIVADMIAAGLIGQPFICPDMVGGGDWIAFIPGSPFEQELFIRSAEIHALCPMMQISASPWRVLDARHQAVFGGVLALRQKFAPKIAALAKKAGEDGEPILRSLEYAYPGRGYAGVIDEFLMGDDLLVAPVLKKGATSREVVLPPGRWRDQYGDVHAGPARITVDAPLGRLPHFVRITQDS